MSKLITNTIRHTGGSADNITLDNSQNVTVEGTVGIGTAANSSYSGSSDDLVIDNGASDVGITLDSEAQCSIAFTDSTKTSWDGWVKYVHSDNHLEFGSGASERLRIDSSGNVGINESSSLMSNGALTIKFGTDKHMGFNSGQGELGSMPGLVAYKDNGSLQDIGIRGDNIRFATGNAERARITDDGLCLGGTGSANAIDDYEEGTYNPTWVGITNYGSGYNDWYYTKIGRLVNILGTLRLNTTVNDGTDVSFTLPFTPKAQSGNTLNISVGQVMHNNVQTGSNGLCTYAYGGNAYGYFYKLVEDSSWTILEANDLSADDTIYVNFTYLT